MSDFQNIITTGIDRLRAAVKTSAEAEGHEARSAASIEALDLALSLVAVFLQNQNRIADALVALAEQKKEPF